MIFKISDMLFQFSFFIIVFLTLNLEKNVLQTVKQIRLIRMSILELFLGTVGIVLCRCVMVSE